MKINTKGIPVVKAMISRTRGADVRPSLENKAAAAITEAGYELDWTETGSNKTQKNIPPVVNYDVEPGDSEEIVISPKLLDAL